MSSWLVLVGIVVALLAVDLVLMRGREAAPTVRQASVASVAWVSIALAFGFGLLVLGDPGQGQAYFAGYLVEKTLSLDNVFVFLLVFGALGVPSADRERLLTFGIVAALVLRAGAIVAGAALLDAFGWVSFLFAALLAWTAWGMLRHRHDHDSEAKLAEGLVRRLPLKGGAAALVAIAVVDLIFAIDSVPAILAITDDTFVVFAANAFALLGMRALYALLEGASDRFEHLGSGLAFILVFVGAKMLLEDLVHLPVALSLLVIVAALAASVLASPRVPEPDRA